MSPTFWWLFFSGLQLYQRETGVFLSILRNFEEYFEVHLIIPTHEYHFTFYFRVLFQRPHFTVLLLIKERRRLKRCKDNVVLSTFLRRCSDVLIITSFYQQFSNVFLTSLTSFYQQYNGVVLISSLQRRFINNITTPLGRLLIDVVFSKLLQPHGMVERRRDEKQQ